MRSNRWMTFALLLAASASVPAQVAAQTLATVDVLPGGPNFARPMYVCAPAGDTQRLFVIEKAGFVRIIKNGVLLGTPFLDIDAIVNSVANERGFLGMAFHPNYASNRKFYVSYTDSAGASVIREYLANSGNPDIADTASFTTIYGPLAQPQSNHNGGCIQFGPDDFLYFGLGDGGNFNDQGAGHAAGGNAQSLGTDLGKMLRINVDSVPPGPAAGNPLGGYKWALGLRNPWRFAFDRANGDLWIADVGQNAWEEVNWTPASSTGGENYGWRCMEGDHCSGLSGCTCDLTGATLRLPVQEYQHSGGNCSITGGYVYRGGAIAGLGGTYFYADYCTGRSWSMRWNGTSVVDFQERTSQLGTLTNPTSFGEDANGEIYVTEDGGRVKRIISEEPGLAFCFGDGSLATACPCAAPDTVPNPSGAPDAGCANSFNLDGAKLGASGATSPDTVQLTGEGLTPSGFAFFIVGDASNPNGTANGDGVICVTGSLTRFGSQNASGGVVTYPNLNPGQGLALSTVGASPPGSGLTRNYQVFYRNSVAGFCNPATSNVSSAYRIVW
ncbi:MAG: PQQ-dependent sugar dehydrogenase [Planctomycetota bacterium]